MIVVFPSFFYNDSKLTYGYIHNFKVVCRSITKYMTFWPMVVKSIIILLNNVQVTIIGHNILLFFISWTLTHFQSSCSTAVKRHNDHENSSKRKHLIGDAYSFSVSVHYYHRETCGDMWQYTGRHGWGSSWEYYIQKTSQQELCPWHSESSTYTCSLTLFLERLQLLLQGNMSHSLSSSAIHWWPNIQTEAYAYHFHSNYEFW